jgi:hypothetical protein
MGVPFLHSFLWFISWFSSKKWGFYGTPIDWTTYGDFYGDFMEDLSEKNGETYSSMLSPTKLTRLI